MKVLGAATVSTDSTVPFYATFYHLGLVRTQQVTLSMTQLKKPPFQQTYSKPSFTSLPATHILTQKSKKSLSNTKTSRPPSHCSFLPARFGTLSNGFLVIELLGRIVSVTVLSSTAATKPSHTYAEFSTGAQYLLTFLLPGSTLRSSPFPNQAKTYSTPKITIVSCYSTPCLRSQKNFS